jgi:glycosyltransferase involved in cell wall biosynthesis
VTKRVLHLFDYVPRGTRAIDHFALEYARQATVRGWQCTLGFTAAAPIEYARQLAAIGAEVLVWKKGTGTFTALEMVPDPFSIPRDVVQTSFLSVFDPAVQRLKTSGFARRLVVIDHSSGVGPSRRSLLTPLRWLRGRRVGRIVDGIACVSRYNARRAVERVFLPADKVAVIPNGIDLARFPFVDKPRSETVTVVYAGQLTAAKGVPTLLAAWALIKNPTIKLLIAGDGPLRAMVEAVTDPRVEYLGHVADVAALFGRADIVVVPSEWAEAFGLVAIEAMACGAAVLASDAGALPEVVTPDAGITFAAGDAHALANLLQNYLINDVALRQRLQHAGRQRVEEHYTLADCVHRHLDFAVSTVRGSN